MKIYKTKQKKAILDFLMKHSNKHFNIKEIYLNIAKNGDNVGKTTVYRNVEKLVKEGLVKKFVLDDTNESCFQYLGKDNCNKHYHLKCEKCMKVIHLSEKETRDIEGYFNNNCNFKVDAEETIFYGICESCVKK